MQIESIVESVELFAMMVDPIGETGDKDDKNSITS